MSGIPLETPMTPVRMTTTTRQRRERDGYLVPDPPPPPAAPPPQPPTISPSWRIPIGLAWAILVFAVMASVAIAGLLADLRQDIRDLKNGVWTIEDQRELQRVASQGGLLLPDTVDIVRRRLTGPHQP